MIRCPFNNFSKCDGSCPFSMPDFVSCRIATALIAIEGQTRGIHEQVDTVNAHLVELKDADSGALPADGASDGPELGKRGHRARYPDATYLVFKARGANGSALRGQPEVMLVLNSEHAAMVLDSVGETCSYVINAADKSIVLMKGTERKLSTGGGSSERRSIYMQKDGQKLVDMFPKARHVYFDVEVFSGMAVLRPNGKVD